MSELTITLTGGTMPSGQVRAADLRLVLALQELTLRIARDDVGTPGPGRSTRPVEELTELRLAGVDAGSTVLVIAQGPDDQLDLELDETRRWSQRRWDVLDAIAADERPEWVSDLIADSAADLVTALRHAAPKVTVTGSHDRAVVIEPHEVHRETWATPRRFASNDVESVIGLLEKVDLHDDTFRVRDQVDNTFELRDVRDPAGAAALIGQRVHAAGRGVHNRANILIGLDEVEVSAYLAPRSTAPPESLASQLARKPGPDPAGSLDLTDEEYEDFLAAVARG